jgi:arginyl-tRNA synthetase
LYNIGREWSLEYLEKIYKRLGTKFDGYYPESLTGEYGYGMVMEGLKKGIFIKGEGGAIIFPGSKYGLHERVFINALGLPTYETKDFGNAIAKQVDFPYDQSIIVTGNEINDYFKVVIKALSLLHTEVGEKAIHLGHGMVRLPEGKMSSRTGKILRGEWLLDEAKKYASKLSDSEEIAEQVGTGAIKYALLKSSIGKDVEFNFEESISFEGNSGPYLQYTFARTQSVLEKGKGESVKGEETKKVLHPLALNLTPEESEILRLLARFPEIVEEAAIRFAPNVLCTYLFELAQSFNLFYQKLPILKADEDARAFRLFLTGKTGNVLKNGLDLLGIKAPQRM